MRKCFAIHHEAAADALLDLWTQVVYCVLKPYLRLHQQQQQQQQQRNGLLGTIDGVGGSLVRELFTAMGGG